MASKKPKLDEAAATLEIEQLILEYEGKVPATSHPALAVAAGKLYELYVLANVLGEMTARGWNVYFVGPRIEMRSGGGPIGHYDPHFELQKSGRLHVEYGVYTDIFVNTLGSTLSAVGDLSAYHEIDIVVVEAGTLGRPNPGQLALGVECKATASFSKSYVREALGRRRELSYYGQAQPCPLDPKKLIKASPPSEYWLVYIDGDGDNYKESPKVFGIELKHLKP